MKKLLELITEEFKKAFEQCGYDKKLGKVGVSNRPDLCLMTILCGEPA